MYASKQEQTITDLTAANTNLTMNHALARVAITVINNGYTGAAKLSEIKFADAKTSLSGSLDATTGAISGTTRADVTLTVPSDNQTITSDGTTYECLLVPSEIKDGRQDVWLYLTIDGDDKFLYLSGNNGVIFKPGVKSTVTITLSNTGIALKSVSINDWNIVEVGGHKVTVKRSSEDGIADDVFLDVTSNGSTVTIKSHSALTGRRTSCTCTPAGKATCTPSIDATTGICTFTITDVQDDITAEVGYLKYNATVEYDSDMGSVKLNGVAVASGSPVQFLGDEEVKFLAEAKSGCRFVKWTDGNDNYLSTDNPYTISSVTSDITLKAIFGYEIAAEVTPVGAGTVTGAGIYAKGSTATLTATAGGSGMEFVGWAKADSPGTIISKDNPYKFTVSQSASYVAVFKLKDALSGVFTVEADRQGKPTKKVQFSKGNLYCSGVEFNNDGTVKSMANAQWGFESNQYDTTPSSNGDRDGNHISHFMWCNTPEKAMALQYDNNWNGETPFFAEKNFTVNGFSGWSTLTGTQQGEWFCLLNLRNTAYGSNRRYAAVKVNGMEGLLIFPDDFSSWPSEAGDEPETFNTYSKTWNERDYTIDQFNTLQNNGCVFLPAAGSRDGKNGYANVKGMGSYGYYRSASPDGSNAFNLFFSDGNVGPNQSHQRSLAMSVRLVTEVK
ncbi:MAG: fimbrillin family protein [Bacteroidales bacterium]|nr:fimbrillin family protein [Bacteroidales bacterium]